MEFKIIIWIIIGAIYLISLLKKKKPQESEVIEEDRKIITPINPPIVKRPDVLHKSPTYQKLNRAPEKKPSTLDDLIREMGKENKPQPSANRPLLKKTKPVEESSEKVFPKYEDYDDNIVDEETIAIEKIRRDREAARAMNEPRLSLRDEETLAVEKMGRDREAARAMNEPRIGLSDEHLEPYMLEKKKKSYYAELFKNPKSVRDAFVMGEILKRKEW